MLAPARRAAARSRDVVAWHQIAGGRCATRWSAIQTPAAFSLSLLRALAVARNQPEPRLLTGAQQDRILAELLAGHMTDGLMLWPDAIPRESIMLPAFREELRNLFMRVADFGMSPAELAVRGRASNRPEWVAAARVLAEYRDVVLLEDLPNGRGERFDSASVVSEAATVLGEWENLTDMPPPTVASVIVDDFQEASPATVRLLHALAARGAHLTLFGDPDVAVQTFRGARPEFVGRAEMDSGLGGFDAERVVLPQVHRGGQRLRDVVATAVQRVPVAGTAEHRSAQPDSSAVVAGMEWGSITGTDRVDCMVFGSVAAEREWIARHLREAHLADGVPWRSMAVILRSGRLQGEMAVGLRALQVPVARGERGVVLRDERYVRPLLLACAAAHEGLSGDVALELVMGPLGALDALGLRQLRRHLRSSAEGLEVADGLLAALGHEERGQGFPDQVRAALQRVARVLAAARAAAASPAAQVESLLWEAWVAAGWESSLRALAVGGGPAGQRADDDLDAVMALFAAAETFTERNPDAHPMEFVRKVMHEDIPSDSLAPRGGRRDAVQVLTAAEAAGQEWDLVVVAGVQQDVWPDIRVRDALLGAEHLSDFELGRIARPGVRRHGSEARAAVLADEARLFVSAISRARRRLVVTAVRSAEDRPSSFLADLGAVHTPAVARRFDLRGVVAALRAELDDNPASEGAAALLAVLAHSGVPGAAPATWAGVGEPTTLAALKRADRPVRMSPSRVEAVSRCPLRWALEGLGGRRADALEQTVGTLVHEIAAAHPHGTVEQLVTALDRRFPSLGLTPGWVGTQTRRDAEHMLTLFAGYAAGVPGEVRTEVEIEQRVGDCVVHGFVDRLEVVEGGVRVVDLKTGAPGGTAEAETNPQLGVYQVALRAAGIPTVGARLVHVPRDPGRRTAAERAQPPIPDDGGWAAALLRQTVDILRRGVFEAVGNDRCGHCPVRRSCPVSGEGERCAQ